MELLRAEVPDAAASILDYFDRTYVHGFSRKIANSDVVQRIEPLFPPEVWNVHDITVSAGDRTNNFAEAWNCRFETMIGHKSPSIWLIIEVLGDDAAEAATTLLRHNSGRLEPHMLRNVCGTSTSGCSVCVQNMTVATETLRVFFCMLSATAYD